MKMNKFITMALVLSMTGGVISSCSKNDDEKTPEVVNDPMKDIVEYYINGRTTDKNGAAVSGATVKIDGETLTTDANGLFKATVTEKGEYTVSVSKDGYLNAEGVAVIANNAANRNVVAVSFTLSEKSENVNVTKEENEGKIVVVTPNDKKDNLNEVKNGSALELPSDKVQDGGLNISMSEYVQEQDAAGSKDGNAAVMNVYVTTDKDVSADKVFIALANPTENGASFRSMYLYRSSKTRAAESSYTLVGETAYDSESNSYIYELKDGNVAGDYSFRVPFTATVSSVQTEEVASGKYDNSGNMNAVKDFKIAYKAKIGSEVTSGFDANLNANLVSLMNNAVSSQAGTNGVSTVDYEATANISGNNIMYYKVENTYVTTTYTFDLTSGKASTTIKTYTGTKVTYTQESADKHSGGTSGSDK